MSKTIPPLSDLFVIDNLVGNISYVPDTKSLVFQTVRREKHSEYSVQIEIPQAVLREIISALKSFAEQSGTSIEGLTTPNSFQ